MPPSSVYVTMDESVSNSNRRYDVEVSCQPLSLEELPLARYLIDSEWGSSYAQRFTSEATNLLRRAFCTPFAALDSTHSIVGIGTITKADIDYALWGIAWLVVSPEHRGLGIGGALIRAMTQYAITNQREFPSSHTVIHLTTRTPAYFRRLGFIEAVRWGDGEASHLMILDTRKTEGAEHETQ